MENKIWANHYATLHAFVTSYLTTLSPQSTGAHVQPFRRGLLPPSSEYSKKAVQDLFLDQPQDERSKLLWNSGAHMTSSPRSVQSALALPLQPQMSHFIQPFSSEGQQKKANTNQHCLPKLKRVAMRCSKLRLRWSRVMVSSSDYTTKGYLMWSSCTRFLGTAIGLRTIGRPNWSTGQDGEPHMFFRNGENYPPHYIPHSKDRNFHTHCRKNLKYETNSAQVFANATFDIPHISLASVSHIRIFLQTLYSVVIKHVLCTSLYASMENINIKSYSVPLSTSVLEIKHAGSWPASTLRTHFTRRANTDSQDDSYTHTHTHTHTHTQIFLLKKLPVLTPWQ